VWIGSAADNEEVVIQGTGITGGSYPAEIWGRYMRAWHEGLEERDYEEPERPNRSSEHLRMDRENDSGGGFTRRPPTGSTTTTTGTTEPPATTTTEAPPTTEPTTLPTLPPEEDP
jgi:membrane peptidoglycan carboxypeptidase